MRQQLEDHHALAVGATFTHCDAPQGLMDVRAKQILRTGSAPEPGQFDASPTDVAEALDPSCVCDDIKTLFTDLESLA